MTLALVTNIIIVITIITIIVMWIRQAEGSELWRLSGITERYWFFCFSIYYMIIIYIHLEIVIIAIIICDFYIKVT